MRKVAVEADAISAAAFAGGAVRNQSPEGGDVPVPEPVHSSHHIHQNYSIPKSRFQGGGRRVAPTTGCADEEVVVEKALANGDIYIGGFAGNVPNGQGKYLWADGCMYEGEWRKGKATGKGKFSWPSGATFEGEFHSGRMEGFGTFTGSEGDTYRGCWVADRKHGYGSKSYANGDHYEGSWRRNLQEGQGRYVWRNGNQYIGEWRGGVFCGRGVLIWTNGNRYDGLWENGVPKGSGVFTWPDGSCYVASWSKGDLKSINGTFYAATTPTRKGVAGKGCPFSPSDEGMLLSPTTPASRKRSSVDIGVPGRGSSASEKNFPRICIWESDIEGGDITCDIIDTLEASMLYKDGLMLNPCSGWLIGTVQGQRTPCCLSTQASKKPGKTITKGHKNYELTLNLQLGIRCSVGKPGSGQLRELKASDFDPSETFWIRFPPEGSKSTPPHQSAEFRWKDYCPMVFRHLRKRFSVDPTDYVLALCGNDALRELSSPGGKSGSFFYLTQDDRFIIKTVKKSEVKVFIRMLPNYYQHVHHYENSLVTKFYGLHSVKLVGGQKVRLIVMGNLFCSEYHIHRRFDLKGSSYGRTTDKAEGEMDETMTLKDLDLNYVFRLQSFYYDELLEQIKCDCEFLESEGIMDYSLLVGLHFLDDILASKMGLSSSCSSPKICGKNESLLGEGALRDFNFSDLASQDLNGIQDVRKSLIRLGANLPARAERTTRNELDPFIVNGGGLLTPTWTGEFHDVVLYIGIIDILQGYDITKKLEHAYKSLQVDSNSISAVDPKLYSRRFQDFISKIFVEDV